ncbi:MAG TPA: EAL domain-containing protein [Xanthomonadaceae bacterium]|nr:EAL domain-containing protein [Xanthomonadaceae bacterium]
MARVSRSSVLLAGNRAQDLLASLERGFSTRFGHCRFALWIPARPDRDGFWIVGQGSEREWRGQQALAFACAGSGHPEAGAAPDPTLAAPVHGADGTVLAVLLCRAEGEHAEAAAWLQDAAALLAQRLPPALELEQLYEAMRQLADAERLQRALYEISDLAGATANMDELLARLHAIVSELMYAENFYIALYDGSAATVRFPYFRDREDTDPPTPSIGYSLTQLRGSLTAWVLESGQPLMGPSEQLAQDYADVGGFGPQSADWLGVPMLRDGEVIGAVVVQSYDEPDRYAERDKALLSFVAQHIATAIERKSAQQELERRVDERTEELRQEVVERQRGERLQRALYRIAELGATTESVEAFYAAMHGVVGDLLFAGNCYIALLSSDGNQISFPYSVDQFDIEREPRTLGRGLTEYVLRTGEPLLGNRAIIADLTRQGHVQSHGALARSWLGVPLVCEDRTVGVMAVQSYDDEHTFDRRDQELLTFVSFHIANALMRKQADESLRSAYAELEHRVSDRTSELAEANSSLREQVAERERAQRQLQHAAMHDALTGLPNRAFLMDRLAEALERYLHDPTRLFAVLFLDLDRFKVINDSVGHLVGDELLKEAGARVARCLPDNGLVARLGGDEFAVLLDRITSEDDATALAQRIITQLDAALRVMGKELYSSTSIGIALAQPHYRTPEELLRDADVAMYRAKANGRRRYELFDEALRQQALQQLELENNLRRALARGEFEPCFQPIMDLTTDAVSGFEVLLRWRRGDGTMVAPAEFLTLAEDTGLAEAIDWQVYEQALEQAAAWLDPQAFISINVGARHFRSPQFVFELENLLARYAIAPERLQLEVTERTLLEEPAEVRAIMQRLDSMGVRLALDDFGTGYSSLSYLHQFPLHRIKIDRSFVAALSESTQGSAAAILRAICTLGETLGLEVIGEGIETIEQRQMLVEMGCRYGQGYLLALPQSAQALAGVRALDAPARAEAGARG